MRIIDIPEFKDKTYVLAMPETTPLMEAIEAMVARNVGSVVVIEGTKVVGIFTERDLLIKVSGKKKKVEELNLAAVMTKSPKTAYMNDTVTDSMRRMSQGRFRHLPIVDDEKNLIGIVSQGDFVAYTWYDLFNQLRDRTKNSFLTNTQLWMLVLGPLIYILILKFFIMTQ
ncbi:CBS domain-containing protein [Candidatus Paracaedibacter symbiosus]|uniref:CBS domain-containing protein n=1 Tax=Candidatus Paracaedibacter symbiosus TaxID=244582 RepID=UPI0005094BF9|nr:CBS domain-containing protein [Candidatus Paracaedibacter symbiosus]